MSKFLSVQVSGRIPVPDDFQLKPFHFADGGSLKLGFVHKGKEIVGTVLKGQIAIKDDARKSRARSR